MERFLWAIVLWKSPREVLKRIKSCAQWMSWWEAISGPRIPIALRLKGGSTILFAGEEADLTFVSSFSLAMGGRGMAKVRLFWEGNEKRAGVLRLEEETPVRVPSEEGNERRMKALATAWLFVKGSKSFA